MYELLGDVLRVTIRLDQSNQIIERCEIVLTAPAGMSYGTSEYNDFVTSAITATRCSCHAHRGRPCGALWAGHRGQ